MAECIQAITEKACETVTPSLYFETWPWLFPEENSKFGAWRALGLMTLHFSSSKVFTDPQMCVTCCYQLLFEIQLLKCATSMMFDIQSFSWDLYFIAHHFLSGANEISGIQSFEVVSFLSTGSQNNLNEMYFCNSVLNTLLLYLLCQMLLPGGVVSDSSSYLMKNDLWIC